MSVRRTHFFPSCLDLIIYSFHTLAREMFEKGPTGFIHLRDTLLLYHHQQILFQDISLYELLPKTSHNSLHFSPPLGVFFRWLPPGGPWCVWGGCQWCWWHGCSSQGVGQCAWTVPSVTRERYRWVQLSFSPFPHHRHSLVTQLRLFGSAVLVQENNPDPNPKITATQNVSFRISASMSTNNSWHYQNVHYSLF